MVAASIATWRTGRKDADRCDGGRLGAVAGAVAVAMFATVEQAHGAARVDTN